MSIFDFLGILFLVVIIGGPLAFGVYAIYAASPEGQRKRRKEEIRAAMQIGMADEELQREVAEEIIRKREEQLRRQFEDDDRR